jgi:hypothetical protein
LKAIFPGYFPKVILPRLFSQGYSPKVIPEVPRNWHPISGMAPTIGLAGTFVNWQDALHAFHNLYRERAEEDNKR